MAAPPSTLQQYNAIHYTKYTIQNTQCTTLYSSTIQCNASLCQTLLNWFTTLLATSKFQCTSELFLEDIHPLQSKWTNSSFEECRKVLDYIAQPCKTQIRFNRMIMRSQKYSICWIFRAFWIWWWWRTARIISLLKIYNLYGVKEHKVEVILKVEMLWIRDDKDKQRTREDRATQLLEGWVLCGCSHSVRIIPKCPEFKHEHRKCSACTGCCSW